MILSTLSLSAANTAQADGGRTALIVVNLDVSTIARAGTGAPFPEDWRTIDDRHVVEANANLITEARSAGLLIIYIHADTTRADGEALASFAKEIAPQDGDILIAQPDAGMNYFRDTILLETLESRGIRSLIFSGVHSGYCVDRNVRIAGSRDFDVTVAADAHSGGQPHVAERYNEYWESLGMNVALSSELDLTSLAATSAATTSSAHSAFPGPMSSHVVFLPHLTLMLAAAVLTFMLLAHPVVRRRRTSSGHWIDDAL